MSCDRTCVTLYTDEDHLAEMQMQVLEKDSVEQLIDT